MNSVDFLLKAEKIKEKINSNFIITFKNNAGSKVILSDPPHMILNRKLLKNEKELNAVFLHELGHIVHPIEQSFRTSFVAAKIFTILQIFLMADIVHLGVFLSRQTGLSRIFITFSLFYLLKILMNLFFKKLTDRLQYSEYISDAFSHINDPHQYLLKRFKNGNTKLMLADIVVRALPVFALLTHPTMNQRIKALEAGTYLDKVKKI